MTDIGIMFVMVRIELGIFGNPLLLHMDVLGGTIPGISTQLRIDIILHGKSKAERPTLIVEIVDSPGKDITVAACAA